MIRTADKYTHEEKSNAAGGEGKAQFEHIWNPETEMHSKNRMLSRITLLPGSSVGYHEHQNEEEVYYILKGEAVLNDNGKEYILKAGDSSLTRHGEKHSIACHGNEPLEFLAIISCY